MGAMKTAAPPARAGPPQRGGGGILTRSDRVRVTWMEFDDAWVKPRQAQVAAQLESMLKTAEQNSRVKGKALEQNKDRIINSMRREFAKAAWAEWEARLEKAHLQPEDWTDMTPEEMFAVEQVLFYEQEEEEDLGAYALAQAQQRQSALSGKTAVEASPPLPSQTISGRNAQVPPPTAAQKAPAPTPQQQSSSWFGWAAAAAAKPFQTTVTEVAEEPQVSVCRGQGPRDGADVCFTCCRNLPRRGARGRMPPSSKRSVRRRRRLLRHNRLPQPRRKQRRAPSRSRNPSLLPLLHRTASWRTPSPSPC